MSLHVQCLIDARLLTGSCLQDKLDKLKERILSKTPSAKVAVFAVDIQNFKDVDKAVEAAVVEFGSIDILVNNVSSIAPRMN